MANRKRPISHGESNLDKSHKTKKAKIGHSKLRKKSKNQSYKLVINIIAAIYYDISYVCILRNAARWMQQESNVAFYRLQCKEAAAVVDRAVAQTINKVSAPSRGLDIKIQQGWKQIQRVISTLGWKLFSIYAHSEAFRRAYLEADEMLWEELMHKLAENLQSIKIFARSRNPDWRGPLLKHANRASQELDQELLPYSNLSHEHPHHIVRTLDGHLRRLTHGSRLQISIGSSIFNLKHFGNTNDPTARRPRHGSCDLCHAKKYYNCTLASFAGSLAELIEYPSKGVGVRSLTNFKKGDIFAEYVGEIRPEDYFDDPIYGLIHQSKTESEDLAVISSQHYGNWTRFINHSCNPSTEFISRTVGRER